MSRLCFVFFNLAQSRFVPLDFILSRGSVVSVKPQHDMGSAVISVNARLRLALAKALSKLSFGG
jgi:hypothetical protein